MEADELHFKILVGVLFGTFVGTRAYFQKVHKGVVTIEVRHERSERLLHLLIVVALIPITVYIFTPWLDSFHVGLPRPVRWAGGFVFVLGNLMFVWVHRSLGRNWSGALEVREDHRLITHGPYRLIRHPMYGSMFLVAAGMGVLAANWLAWSYFCALLILYIVRRKSEEKMMLDHFGDEYKEYCERTGRLFPSSRTLSKT